MAVVDKSPRANPWLPWQVLAIVAAVFWVYGRRSTAAGSGMMIFT